MADIAIATVKAVFGKAYARDADGELRELKPGDVLHEGETVVTPDGSSVELSMSDGSPLVVADMPEMTLTSDLLADTASTREESEVTDETVDAVLAALEGDGDLGDVLEATAAGLGGAGGPGGGHSFIRLGRIAEDTDTFTFGANYVGPEAAAFDTGEAERLVDAIDDVIEAEPDTPVVIDVRDNDDFTPDEIITSVTQGQNGTVVINPDNTVTYTPNDGFSGTDTFTYTATTPDGGQEDTATVTVIIPEPPAPPPPPPPPEEPPVEIRISDVTVREGDEAVQFITLNEASDEDITLNFETADGSATVEGGDYDPDAGTLTIPAGTTEVIVITQTNEDALVEGTENYSVVISDATSGVIVDNTGVVTIIDEPVISITDVTVNEGADATLTVSLSEASDEEVTVQFASADGSAVSGSDYDSATGTITFAPGQTETTITFSTIDDSIVENTEQFVANLSNATGAVIADPQGVVTILDNDAPPPPPPPPRPRRPRRPRRRHLLVRFRSARARGRSTRPTCLGAPALMAVRLLAPARSR